MSARDVVGGVAILAGLGAGGLLAYALLRSSSSSGRPFGAGGYDVPGLSNVGLWPDLRVGDLVLVDGDRAKLGVSGSDLIARVDLVLTDRSLISVQVIDPRVLALGRRVGGTIPRDAIVGLLGVPSLPVSPSTNV